MCVALVGGMERLERHYRDEAGRLGVRLKVFNGPERGLAGKLGRADAVVIVTGKVSHRAKAEACRAAARRGIPVLMCEGCGLCSLRETLNSITKSKPKSDRGGNTRC